MNLETHTSLHASPISERVAATPTTIKVSNSVCLQQFAGDIDTETAPDFAAALDRVFSQRPEGVILDMSRIEFLNVSGLSILARFCSEAKRDDIPVALVGGRPVARPIEACGLATDVDLCDSVNEAGAVLETAAAAS